MSPLALIFWLTIWRDPIGLSAKKVLFLGSLQGSPKMDCQLLLHAAAKNHGFQHLYLNFLPISCMSR